VRHLGQRIQQDSSQLFTDKTPIRRCAQIQAQVIDHRRKFGQQAQPLQPFVAQRFDRQIRRQTKANANCDFWPFFPAYRSNCANQGLQSRIAPRERLSGHRAELDAAKIQFQQFKGPFAGLVDSPGQPRAA